MFVSVLLPFAERGAGPLHHWVMLIQMARFAPDEIVFVADAAYFEESHIPFGQTLKVGELRFVCPDQDRYRQFRKVVLDDGLLDGLSREGRSHLDVFRSLLEKPMPVLVDALQSVLKEFVEAGNLEAVLTWSNCPSLRAALDALGGGMIIHNELGPLRGGLYRDTCYFDLQGVNGNSTPAGWDLRRIRVLMQGATLLKLEELRGLLLADVARVHSIERKAPTFRAGIALQVEDDSNALVYSGGWDSLSLLYDVMGRVGPGAMLVRAHPGARFAYRGGLGVVDDSADSLEFIGKVEKVVSINSSVLAEAAFWGCPIEIKGDSPARCLAGLDQRTKNDRLLACNAFFLGYLVPVELLFNPVYYRWRLTGASLAQCHEQHVSLLRNCSGTTPIRVSEIHPPSGKKLSPDSRLIRLPAIWTSQLSIERKAEELRHQLRDMTTRQELTLHWEKEAESNWKQLQELSAHAAELKTRLDQALGRIEEAEAAVALSRQLEQESASHRLLAQTWQQEAETNRKQAQELSAHAAELKTRLDQALGRIEEADAALALSRQLEQESASHRLLAQTWQQEAESNWKQLQELSAHAAELKTRLDQALGRIEEAEAAVALSRQLEQESASHRLLAQTWQQEAETNRKQAQELSAHAAELETRLEYALRRIEETEAAVALSRRLEQESAAHKLTAEKWQQEAEANDRQLQDLSARMADLHLQLGQSLARISAMTEEMDALRRARQSWLERLFGKSASNNGR